MRRHRRHRRAIGIGRRVIHHVLQQHYRQFGIDRIGDRQPDALPERGQRIRLVGEKHDVTGLDRTLPGFRRYVEIECFASSVPGVFVLLQFNQRAPKIEQQIGARQRFVSGWQLNQFLLQLFYSTFQQTGRVLCVLAAVHVGHQRIVFEIFIGHESFTL